eukprot:15360297-Ditylum_brightwellii.AAC.1
MLYYMGVASLPLTADYWSSHPGMPKHSVMTELGMSRDCYILCGGIFTFMKKSIWSRNKGMMKKTSARRKMQ